MIEQGLHSTNFVGRDGFIWWIGQIPDETTWIANQPSHAENVKDQKGFGYRYKVRIMGYHTASHQDLSDEDLPWASVMLPVTAGGGKGSSYQTPKLRQGDFVYGFFIDGENAQQPVIMGIIGNNQDVSIEKLIPKCGGFLPFSGFYSPGDGSNPKVGLENRVPRNALPVEQEAPVVKQVKPPCESTNPNNTVADESNTSLSGGIEDGATKEAVANEKVVQQKKETSRCKQIDITGIQRDTKNLLATVGRLKKSQTDWATRVSTNVDNIEKEIARVTADATEAISGKVKTITEEIEKNTLKKVNDSLKDTYYNLLPSERPQLMKEVQKANDGMSCAFKNIIKNIFKMVGSFLGEAIDKFITAPLCAIQNFVGNLLGKITGFIDSAVSSVLQPVRSLLAGMSGATDLLGDVVGFAVDALSFLTCEEEPECAAVEEWSPGQGPEKIASLDLNSVISKARSVASQITGAFDQLSNIGGTISDIADDMNFGDMFEDSCNVGPLFCGPPTVEFFGGKGSGGAANAIVSAAGSILGVEIILPGQYETPPFVQFKDSCGKGGGASGEVELDEDGKIIRVGVRDSGWGYLPAPNGSQGGDGRTWADEDETTIKRKDGKYDTPYKPGLVVNVCPGDEVTHPGGDTEVIGGDECRNITTKPPTVPVLPGGIYDVTLELEDVIILDPGFNYTSDDEVICPNGAELVPEFDDLGSLKKISIAKGGIGFTEDPNIYIKSPTGYNAKIMPVFKVNRLEDEVSPPVGDIIQVIDCVGKV